ncbi:DUF397 domain-containing protein [Actinomadura scrupuli]|uniref:DUF397 domain-containing protein n=1 Tax=Actinomadura scrupuli TaxID=559629 RepID=UPI003D99E70B
MDLSNARWRKASRSTDNGGNCVEVAPVSGAIAVRDSKNPTGPALTLTRDTWRTFTEKLKRL